MPHCPVVVILCAVICDATLNHSVVELREADLLVFAWYCHHKLWSVAILPRRLLPLSLPPITVQPFEMDGVKRILLALKPIARQLSDTDCRETILVCIGLPGRY